MAPPAICPEDGSAACGVCGVYGWLPRLSAQRTALQHAVCVVCMDGSPGYLPQRTLCSMRCVWCVWMAPPAICPRGRSAACGVCGVYGWLPRLSAPEDALQHAVCVVCMDGSPGYLPQRT